MIDCKRYIVLAGLYYHPRNWGEQYYGEYDTIEEAMHQAYTLCVGYKFYYDWFEVIDLETKRVVASSDPKWNDVQPKPRVKVKGIVNETK